MSNFQEVTIKQEETGEVAPVQMSETPRPDNVPEQFWDPIKGEMKMDDMLAALTGKADETTEAPKEGEEAPKEGEEAPKEGDEEKTAEEQEAARIAAEAGVDVAAVEAAFVETGKIDDVVYEKLSKVGISKDVVDEFVQYRVGQADRVKSEMFQPYGGEEAVVKMTEWAGENWTEAQAKAFNEAANSADRGKIELALKGLKADFDKKNGVRPSLLQGKTVPATNGAFSSMAELMTAQRDPRYTTDPAYRDAVMAKLSRSKI